MDVAIPNQIHNQIVFGFESTQNELNKPSLATYLNMTIGYI